MGHLVSRFAQSLLRALSSSRQQLVSPVWLRAEAEERQVQRIQQAMTQALLTASADSGANDARSMRLGLRIQSAHEIMHLWYLRCDLMQVISAGRTEASARVILRPITAMFDELVPASMRSRPSPAQRRQQHNNDSAQGIPA
jgi:hypothetical protein